MFEQSFLAHSHARRSWSVAVSTAFQAALVGLVAMLPLIFTYELSLDELGLHRIQLVPPAPPRPAPPPEARVVQAAEPARFDEILMQPKVIPDQVALIDDKTPPMALSAPDPSGVAGAVSGLPQPLLNAVGFIPTPPPVKPIRVGGQVQAARLINRVEPDYPQDAREQSITGVVVLEAIIDAHGAVRDLELVEGHPMLAPGAIEAVSQWRYMPTRLNGEPVEVITRVELHYTLIAPLDPKELKKQQRRGRREAKQKQSELP